jgi:hypothetical protein
MRVPLVLALAGALTCSAAVAADHRSGEGELARLLAGRQAGTPVTCISSPDIDRVQVIDGTAIVYGDGSRLFVNRLQASAPVLRSDDVLVTSIWGSQLCRLDTIKLLDRNSRMVRGFVVLGPFVPYQRPR